jgi:CO/xanthine dehydrogenase Mo-binding subunit
LLEQATFEDGRSSARDWLSYPILTFDRIPEIETVFVERKNEPSVGVGEASQGPIAAAIANAVFAAAGIRLRRIPLTPARVLAALSEKQNREG